MAEMGTLIDLESAAAKTNLKGKHLISIDDLTKEEIEALFKLAELLEPFTKGGLNIMAGKVLASLFFEPSTRTRLSFETAMARLGGAVITETTPLISSSAAKEESLADMLRVVSNYVDLIVLRHFDAKTATEGMQASQVPVISGGFGGKEHPTQALLDLYTIWRTFGRIEGLKVVIGSADLLRARTGHSLALGLAKFKAKVILASPQAYRTAPEVMSRLAEMKADYSEALDLSQRVFNELVASADVVYLPGCRVPKGPEREAFHALTANYFIHLETLQQEQQRSGKTVGVMHCLPRFPGEMDLRIDATPHELYFKQVAFSIPIRMALILSILQGG